MLISMFIFIFVFRILATVRQIILDIERLLVMRDNPPQHPDT